MQPYFISAVVVDDTDSLGYVTYRLPLVLRTFSLIFKTVTPCYRVPCPAPPQTCTLAADCRSSPACRWTWVLPNKSIIATRCLSLSSNSCRRSLLLTNQFPHLFRRRGWRQQWATSKGELALQFTNVRRNKPIDGGYLLYVASLALTLYEHDVCPSVRLFVCLYVEDPVGYGKYLHFGGNNLSNGATH